MLTPARRALSVLAAAVVLAGCTGGSSSPLNQALIEQDAAQSGGRSWMAPSAKNQDLLYVSDRSTFNDVYVFSYPERKLVGTLTGFDDPGGLCVDKSGDVWIVNTQSAELIEYAHGGTVPIASLSDPAPYPLDCAVDPTTGNLAITNLIGAPSGPAGGGVAIYTHASGTPRMYLDSAMYYAYLCGYDKQGNLFVDGTTESNGGFQLAELPKARASTLVNISLNQSIGFPGGVQWHGKYLSVGDAQVGVIYQLQITPSGAEVVGSTSLAGWEPNGVGQPWKYWIQGNRVISPDYGASDVGFYAYPAGGNAANVLTQPPYYPVGAVVSKAKG